MTRRFLGLSGSTWRILAAGAVTALWMLVAWTATAYANDCAAYVNDPKNFTGNLQGLIEDCMRTGYVQAVTTLLVGGIGGGGIAVAVTKGLQGTDKNWKDPNLAGPGDGEKPGDEKKDGETPEAPPPVTGRDTVPDACRSLWDDYYKATQDEFQKGKDVATVTNWYHHVVNNHMSNLAKVTIQLGVDAADMASAGAGGIKGGMGVAKAVAHLPETLAAIKNLLAKAVARAGNLETLIHMLAEGIADLLSKGRSFASAADDAGRLSAKAESKIADLVKEAAALEGQAAKFDELVRFSRTADKTLLERNAASKALSAADDSLGDAQRTHEQIKNRRQGTADWAARERAAINRRKLDELHNARERHAKLRAETAEQAKKAHADWQNKMSELRTAKKELDEARELARHMASQRLARDRAKQKLQRAKVVEEETATHVKHAEAELEGFDDALKRHAEIPDLEAAEKALAQRVEALKKATATRKKFLDAETALDEASVALDGVDARIRQLEAELKAVGKSDYLDNLIEKERRTADALHKCEQDQHYLKKEVENAKQLEGGVDDRVQKAREARGEDAPFTPEELAEMEDARQYTIRITREYDASKRRTAEALVEHSPNRDALSAEREALKPIIERETERITPLIEEAKSGRPKLEGDLKAAQTQFDQASKEYQPYAHRGIDPESGSALEAEHARLKADLEAKKVWAENHPAEAAHRPVLENKLQDAKQKSDHAKGGIAEAEAELASAEEQITIGDLSGTGEPLDTKRRYDMADQEYNRLNAEQDALRQKYEEVKAGGEGRAAEGDAAIERLENEQKNWTDFSWETEAAERNPEKFADWKEDIANPQRVGDAWDKVSELQQKVTDLQTSFATIERKLAEQQGKTGGKSTAELEAERDKLMEQIKTKQSEVETAKSEKQTQDQARAQAEKDKEQADKDRQKKEAEKQKAEDEKRKNDEEIARLQRLQDNPVPAPEDVSWLGKTFGIGPALGKDWTPYHGSEAEGIANKSHELRQKFDGVMDAITPDWLTWPFRKAGSKAGELFHKAFGGQSPEEVAAALKHGQQRVKEMEAQLKQVQEEFDALRKKAHEAKAALDTCCEANRPPVSRAESN